MVDAAYSAASDLAATNVSFDGCNAIVNNERWLMRRYKVRTLILTLTLTPIPKSNPNPNQVRGHAAGTASFGYPHDPSWSRHAVSSK